MDEKEKEIFIECPLKYSLSDNAGAATGGGEARASIDNEYLSLVPDLGEALSLPLRDIVSFSAFDYRIELLLTSQETAALFHLGNRYEDFLRILTGCRNQVILGDMLMEESLRQGGIRGKIVFSDANGAEILGSEAELRFYDTAMVVLPDMGDLRRIPYSSISKFSEGDYLITVETEDGEKAIVSQLGSSYDLFKRCLSGSVNDLNLKAQTLVKELFPEGNPALIRKAANFMKEGRAARRIDLEAVSPDLWKWIERQLSVYGMKEEYDFLSAISQRERVAIGFKRGLMGDLTGQYLWLLIPIYGTKPDEPGNAVVMEAASDEGGGRATYVFRIVSRRDYAMVKGSDVLHEETDRFLRTANRCMIDINFRREPLYLQEERLNDPRYTHYRFSILRLPSLRFLRERYIGRIIHSSAEQWQKDIMDLLKFNVRSQEDGEVWKREMPMP